MQTLPYELKIHSSADDEMSFGEEFTFVKGFAKETGDFKTLSKTDMKVIALGVKLAKESGEDEKL